MTVIQRFVAWEQRKLGENSQILAGGTPKTKIKEYWEPKEIPWMSSGEINKKRLRETDNKISQIGYDNSNARWVKNNSVLIALAGQGKTRGTVAINEIPLTTNQSIAAIEPNNKLISEFLFHNLDRRYEELRLVSSGAGTRGGLNKKLISEIEIMTPSIHEQIQVGQFFKKLDNTIALHQEKLDRLDELKKGYMQNVLPQKEQDLPKVRFTHYHGKWEQCKLGKIANIKMGQSPNGNSYTNNPNDHILVQGNADLKNGEVVPRVWTTQVTKTANPKDIILSVRAPVGDVAKTNYSVVLGRGVAGIDGNEFIYQNLLNLKVNGYWKRYSTGSTFESINSNDLKDASIFVPSKKEQYMIGDLLEKLDKNIFLQQTKINKLVDLKKSFLQRMFI